jgi:hypothetical protein
MSLAVGMARADAGGKQDRHGGQGGMGRGRRGMRGRVPEGSTGGMPAARMLSAYAVKEADQNIDSLC